VSKESREFGVGSLESLPPLPFAALRLLTGGSKTLNPPVVRSDKPSEDHERKIKPAFLIFSADLTTAFRSGFPPVGRV